MSSFFNPEEDFIEKTRGNLPHRHQNNKIQSVTFRLYDSLPQCVLGDLKKWIKLFYRFNPKPWKPETEKRYKNTITPYYQRMLDNDYGSCVLKYKNIRDIVSSAIFFKDEDNYLVHAFVIMPNHVHLLLQPFDEHELEDIMQSIKSFTSRRINRLIGSSGQLWGRESWDRLVRSERHYKHCVEYIRNNPRNLPTDQFTLYIRQF